MRRLLCLAMACLAASCGEAASTPDAGKRCAPGESRACACDGGSGSETCDATGDAFGSCVCPEIAIDAGPVELATVQKAIFSINCTTSSCHSVDRAAGNLVLVNGKAYSSLVKVLADNPAAKAKGTLRVVPGDASKSFLWTKLNVPGAEEGSRMPQGLTLTPDKLALVRRWIEGGVLCTPQSCAELKANCGDTDDGCGKKIPCGTCTAPQTCGGGGVENVCGS